MLTFIVITGQKQYISFVELPLDIILPNWSYELFCENLKPPTLSSKRGMFQIRDIIHTLLKNLILTCTCENNHYLKPI